MKAKGLTDLVLPPARISVRTEDSEMEERRQSGTIQSGWVGRLIEPCLGLVWFGLGFRNSGRHQRPPQGSIHPLVQIRVAPGLSVSIFISGMAFGRRSLTPGS